MHLTVLDGETLNPGDLSWEWLKDFGDCTIYENSRPDQVLERSAAADILLVNKVVLDSEIIRRLPKLQFVAVTATGYNNIDVAACAEAGIPVSNVVNYGSTTVAQHVFALLLALTNRVERHFELVRNGEWGKRNIFSFWDAPLVELAGKTMGIIGMGNIGQEVARIADGFRMEVIYYSSSGRPCPEGRPVALETLREQADCISLNTHLHDGNREMIDAAFLDGMKNTAYLINTARGGLVNEADLHKALTSGMIAGAGLDVLDREPPSDDHILLRLDNCIVTPHIAWASVEARHRMMGLVRENIEAFLAGSPIHLVD